MSKGAEMSHRMGTYLRLELLHLARVAVVPEHDARVTAHGQELLGGVHTGQVEIGRKETALQPCRNLLDNLRQRRPLPDGAQLLAAGHVLAGVNCASGQDGDFGIPQFSPFLGVVSLSFLRLSKTINKTPFADIWQRPLDQAKWTALLGGYFQKLYLSQ